MNKNTTPIELRSWRQFLVLAEELHFGRAASRLHMTQPPMSQAIAKLEQVLGVSLFDRTQRRVALTPAGEALVPDVRELLARAQALPQRARAAAAGEVGRLRLGFVSTIGFERLPVWVREFRARCPGVALELVEATGDVQLDALARGDIDAGFMLHVPGQAPVGWAHCTVAREPLALALPARHRLARTSPMPWEQLLAEPLVIFPRRILPSLYDAILELYRHAGRVPLVAQEAIQMQTIVNLVWGGLGLAWVPESVTRFRRSGVVYRQADAWDGLSKGGRESRLPLCETSLVWPEPGALASNPALERFVQFVRERGRVS